MAAFFPGNRVVPKISGAEIVSLRAVLSLRMIYSLALQGRYAIAPFQLGFSPVGMMIGVFQLITFAWFVATHTLLTVFLETPVEEGGYGFTPQRNALCKCSHMRPLPLRAYNLQSYSRSGSAWVPHSSGVLPSTIVWLSGCVAGTVDSGRWSA